MHDRSFPFRPSVASIAGVLTEPIEHAFTTIVVRHRNELHRHCVRLLGSPAEAEDAVQETFLRAWRSLQTFCTGTSMRAWLYRIATNACFDLLAKRRPLDGELDASPEPVAPCEQQPESVVVAKETVELALLTAIRHLPERQHTSLVMRDVLRWTADETATALSTTVPATNSALQRARGGLRAHLAPRRLDWTCAAPTPPERRALDCYLSALEAARTATAATLRVEPSPLARCA
jgi:RNA polymerase sigma-70 factor (ECF subfamily)